MIGKIVSHYHILEKLGEGGMGVVYKAEDTKLKRTVALKFLPPELTRDPEAKERFIQEAQAASALDHPNICTIHEIDETEDGQMFIVMACYEGETLKKKVASGQLSVDGAIDIAIQIAQGLAKAHEHGIVHRDIKPANVMITNDGVAKILDFGLAKLAGQVRITKTGTTMGTIAYMSPEQARGEEVDNRTDIWSLGVVLYEMLTGELPFKGEYEQAVIYSILNEEPKPVTALRAMAPIELERLVSKTLAKHPDERYQHIEELIANLENERQKLAYLPRGQLSSGQVKRKRRRFLSVLIPVTIVFILAILFFIFKPFQIEIGPQKAVHAEENRLAIMYLNNLTDPQDSEKLGEIATNLLITDLTESNYLNVVSSQRLYDILKLLGREGEKKIDRDVATAVAMKARCRWMLLGNILQARPRLIITSQLVDVASGSAIASQRISGEADDNIFTLVDKLAVEIKNDLALPAAAMKEPDRPVADVTTHSAEAYRCYLLGIDRLHKMYDQEAASYFTRTIEYDSTFAMAYLWLAFIKRETAEAKKMILKAERYSTKVNQKERHYIRAMKAVLSRHYVQAIQELQNIVTRYPDEKEAFLWLGIIYGQRLQQPQQAIGALTKAIEIDPLYKFCYNLLAYAYNEIGDADKAIWAINQYIALAPDEANPYDTRGDLYAYHGKIDQAIESYKKALEIKPDFSLSLDKLGYMHLFKTEYPEAESCFKKIASSSEKATRSKGRLYLALIPLFQGRLEQALEILDDGIAADRMEQAEGWQNSDKHLQKAWIYGEKKNLTLALAEMERCMEIYRKAYPDRTVYERHYYVQLLAEQGDFKKAEAMAMVLKKDIEEKDPTQMCFYWQAIGYLDLTKGNFAVAATHFEKAVKETPSFGVHFGLGRAYLEIGRLDEAVANLQKALSLSRYDSFSEYREYNVIAAVKAHYLLGLAYERSGWKTKAIEQYQEFLDFWNDADPEMGEVEDAKARLQALKGGS